MNHPTEPSFEQKGLKGYTFPTSNKELEVNFVDVTEGHDNYIVSKKCSLTYYILEGTGNFEIDGRMEDISEGSLIEVLPNTEFTYSGKMKLLLMVTPPWFEGNEEVTKKNPNVK